VPQRVGRHAPHAVGRRLHGGANLALTLAIMSMKALR